MSLWVPIWIWRRSIQLGQSRRSLKKALPLLPAMLLKEAEDKEDVKAVTPKKETGRIHEAGAKKRKEPEEGTATITGNNPPKEAEDEKYSKAVTLTDETEEILEDEV